MSKAMTKRKAPQVYNYVNCPAVKFKKLSKIAYNA